ncbi:PAS domain-containing sensor histidine kinase [Aureimonas jatrophae]|uniref:histidine kinase n=1 Tax=Aureimonas jatrophae TaxID=1166073 RepID=A0A1H0N7G2_9HYPH|nr:PAS domain-containing sensor histidine kinase [Aureimonas jatrophae]MBB3951595.1 two-component sensor histidine kinase [Aureimonas jatrophae]SDO88571.1 Two-component sensor histidine kinase, contains HisKA and HATPase domains [Aureimonas jatrophae]
MIPLRPESDPETFEDYLRKQGWIGAAILGKTWAETSLGPIAGWPQALKATIRLALGSRQHMVFFWGPDLLQFFNEAYSPTIVGMPPDPIGAPFEVYWAEVLEGVRPFAEQALSGHGTWYEDLPLRLTRGGVTKDTYWTFSYSPLYDDAGRISGFMNVVNETTRTVEARNALAGANALVASEYEKTRQALTSQREAEKRQRLLQRELAHRMKNTLAMVQAVVTQSLRHAPSLDEAAEVVSARIQALGRAQEMLTEANWEASDIREVLETALEPHKDGDDRFRFQGPAVGLSSQQAMGLALAVHELATNAAKYGALAQETGRIEVSWTAQDDRSFLFSWSESGGPPVAAPDRKGFGSRLVERVVPGYFVGRGELRYRPDGLAYRLNGSLDPEA